MIEQYSKQVINKPQPVTFMLIAFLGGLYFSINLNFSSRVLWKLALIPYEIEVNNFVGLFTSPFFHTSFLHLFLDIAFIWQRFSLVERRAGRLFLVFHMIIFSLTTGFLYCSIIILFSYAGEFSLFYKPIMGFTSIIIAMSVVEIHLSSQQYASILGLVHVPLKYLPFAISITFHIALGNTSTLSHLCALSIGYIYWILFGRQLKKRWGHQMIKDAQKNKKDDETPPFKLPGTVIATFDVKSPGESQFTSDNSGYARSKLEEIE